MPPTLVEFIGCIAASILLSAVYTYLARLVWHPLAKFPGPKLAGASRLYEVYHQVYKSDWLENLSALHDKYGPLIRIGPNELHSIDNQWNLQHHRRRDLKKCTDYYGVLDTVLGGFQQPHHHAARGSIVRPLFTGSILADFSDGPLNDLTEKLLRRMTSVAEKNSKLDATHLIWAFTTDAMLLYVLGENSRYLDMEDIENFHDETRALSVIDYATVLRTMPLVNLVINYFPALKGLSVHSWIEKRVRTHLHLNEEKRLYGDNILGRLRSRLDDETAIQEAAQAIFIGNESMLSNLTFIIHHLIHNPESVHRLRQELYAADATESPNATAGQGQDPIWRHSRVAQLPYLDAVLRESTRLSAPAWHRQPRAIDEVLEYDNKEIPPMTSFSFTLRLLERDPARYSDPDKFVPERWLGATKETQDLKQMSATFGTGSRMCLGQHIARQVLRKTIACLVYHFDFALWDPQKDHAENYRYMATFPQKGKEGTLQLCLKPRL